MLCQSAICFWPYADQYFLNPLKSKNEKKIYLDLRENFNTEYWLSIPTHTKDYYSVYFFCANRDKPYIINTFTTHIDLFQNFILQFEDAARSIITNAGKNRIVTHWPPRNSFATLPPKYNLDITSRESECIAFIMNGLSAKEIGKKLNISYRTVEKYIDSLKLKFTSTNKSRLISNLYKYYYSDCSNVYTYHNRN